MTFRTLVGRDFINDAGESLGIRPWPGTCVHPNFIASSLFSISISFYLIDPTLHSLSTDLLRFT